MFWFNRSVEEYSTVLLKQANKASKKRLTALMVLNFGESMLLEKLLGASILLAVIILIPFVGITSALTIVAGVLLLLVRY